MLRGLLRRYHDVAREIIRKDFLEFSKICPASCFWGVPGVHFERKNVICIFWYRNNSYTSEESWNTNSSVAWTTSREGTEVGGSGTSLQVLGGGVTDSVSLLVSGNMGGGAQSWPMAAIRGVPES